MTRDVIYVVSWKAEISTKKKAPINFHIPQDEFGSTLKIADMLMHNWNGGRHASVDLNEIYPLNNEVFISRSYNYKDISYKNT